jgi:hypothetical protein
MELFESQKFYDLKYCLKELLPMRIYPNFLSRCYQYFKTGSRRGTGNPRWLLMFILGRFKLFRSIMISFHRNPGHYNVEQSIFKELDIYRAVDTLKRDGAYLGINLPNEILHKLLDYTSTHDCYADSSHQFGFNYAQKQEAEKKYKKAFVEADYFNATLLCPAIWKLSHDPKLLYIASHYLGGKPLYTGSRLWWLFTKGEKEKNLLLSDMTFLSLRKEARNGSYFFHYDLDDYRCLKFFFYLTEVDSSAGPHMFVQGSHERKKISHLYSLFRRCSDEAIEEFYNAENIVTICGKPGFGFAEDTFCFHKAAFPTAKDRLVLLLQFTLNDYGNQMDVVDSRLLERML